MKTSIKLTLLFWTLSTVFTACRKDPSPKPATPAVTGQMTIAITNTADSSILALNQYYKDANGDSISVSIFNYYISNIVLTTDSGKTFAETNSYHLVQQAVQGSGTFTIGNVPVGNYTSITFLIGVDSLHNVSGAQSGELDPVNGMFWDWSTGYIMAKMEGTASVSGSPRFFQLHIGGFSGQYSALRKVTINLPQPVTVTNGGLVTAFMHADAMSWFKTPHLINMSTFTSTMSPNANSVLIADNYANMFGIDSVK
ncbi:MAG: hypothetical protein P4L41_01590 [Flavipsychrobacter sp.]|nr:hypothetical protein [Flavipsychrobacter sp.]